MKKMMHDLAIIWSVILMLVFLPSCNPIANHEVSTTPGSSTSSTVTLQQTQPGSQLPVLEINVLMDQQEANPFPSPADTPLWDAIRDRLSQAAGYQIIPKVQSSEMLYDDLKTYATSNSLPDVLMMNPMAAFSMPGNEMTERVTGSAFRSLSMQDFQQNMPNLVKRIQAYGMDFETEFLASHVVNGINPYIPTLMNMSAFPNLPDCFTDNPDPSLPFLTKDMSVAHYDNLMVRDDLLKKIFPDAKSEEELHSFYVQKQGKLTVEDVAGDIPVRTLDDLYDYLIRMQSMKLVLQDGSPLIPAKLDYPYRATGDFARYPVSFGQTPGEADCYLRSKAFKGLLQWMNKAYHAGLIDESDLSLSIEQYQERLMKGAYAVVSAGDFTLYDTGEADTFRKAVGCGLRLLPMGYGVTDFALDNNKYENVKLTAQRGIFLNVRLTDDEVKAVMKWIDFQMSEDFDELCYWGLPEWSAGEGDTRRFKPEYASLQSWALSGAMGEGEDIESGLLSLPALASTGMIVDLPMMPYAVRIASFFRMDLSFPEVPCYVTPMAESALLAADMLCACDKIMEAQDILPRQIVVLDCPAWQGMSLQLITKNPVFANLPIRPSAALSYDDIRAIVIDDPNHFAKNWSAYQAKLASDGLDEAVKNARNDIVECWQTLVLDRVID